VRPEEVPEGGATLALYLECSDNDWRSDGGRFWTHERGPLLPGVSPYVLNVPLTWEHWVTVQGPNSPELFAASLPKVVRAGFTFGGPDGAGHGVWAEAPAKFRLINFG
jgi:hypothetical protein